MIGLSLILAFVCSLGLTLAAVPVIIRLATAHGYVDAPGSSGAAVSKESWRKIHSTAVPRLGGVALVFGFVITYLIFADVNRYLGLFLLSLVIFAVGVTDDLKSLSPKVRIIAQSICAGVAVWHSQLTITTLALTPSAQLALPPALGFLLAMFVIIGAINSTNMSDGLDGLAAGLVLIGIVFLSLIHYLRTEDVSLIVSFCLPVVGVTLGFLRYNTHPASIFMGDGGSNWLGFVLGVLFLFILTEPASRGAAPGVRMFPFVAVFMGSAIPIVDAACVIFSRFRRGHSPASADKSHFHHSMLRVGLTHAQSVTAIYFFALIFGITGILPIAYPPPKYQFWPIPYAASAALIALILAGQSLTEGVVRNLANRRLLVSQSTAFGSRLRTTIRYWENLNKYVVYIVLAVLPAFAGVARPEIGYAAGAGAAIVLASIFLPQRKADFLDSTMLMVGVGILLAANNQQVLTILWQGKAYNIQSLYNALFVFLFFSSSLFILVTMRKKYLVITPSDFLLASVPIILIFAPEPFRTDYRLSIISLRCLVLFMVLRTFAKRRQRTIYNIRIIAVISLSYVMATSLFGFRIAY